ncbi:GntR family transcriptional regulator [Ancylobacter sp. Lp-2]|uniref:GntR family transcriptional regulator n=1 Tax=Ancylobacter sp. Lp-2 TaxID=2881339 RepID=UPI001E2D4C94|nr:GntR family transcriptional regulator [Ancylobacter sp. Lp-2]MCB4770196.1 GntR family transcriptional regulator [Ancylobacter sp. Lp-2]
MNVTAIPRPSRDPHRHAAPQVFDYLRERIVNLQLPPGTVISRAELQELFGFSSTPVRDALLRLQEESLVEIFPQHATVVSPIDLRLARQAQFLRRSIEQEAVRTLALLPDTERRPVAERLETAIDIQAALLGRGDLEAFHVADRDFHRLFFEAVGVPDLWVLARRHAGHIDRIRRLHLPIPGKAEQVIADHRAIVAGIAAGDLGAAQAALRTHLSKSLAFTPDLRARWPAYFRD